MKIRLKLRSNLIIAAAFLSLISCNDRRSTSTEEPAKIDTVGTTKVITASATPIKISTSHFYFENSGSMDGYVNGHYDIQVVLRELLFAIESKSDNQKFYFFNTQPHPQGNSTKDFLKKLTTAGIKVGNRSTSDLNLMLETVLSSTKDGDISFLVTDGIYSVNGDRATVLGKLKSASVGSFYKFKNRLDKSDVQTILIKLESRFNGYYYPAKGGNIKINQNRPYYVWIFGSPERIDRVRKEVNFTNLPGYLNHAIFQVNEEESPYYSIHPSYAREGEFRNERSGKVGGPVTSITNVEKDRRSGGFQFAVGVDMKKVTAEESYILKPENYQLSSDKYQIKEIVTADNLTGKHANQIQGTPITHLIVLNTSSYPVDNLEISLSNKLPAWIGKTHSNDDSKIKGDSETTFGFQYLIDGIARAYQRQSDSPEYFNISVNIKK
ncbi:hypothetical protein [Nafulsella turpanensis]|uniref:hypothetical protein n=1 Tax=Nafulsella turpanensis TaxID=1265690 RepID=UPI001267DA48|nr:hypothetical protein [Nafulsella turpanensis]